MVTEGWEGWVEELGRWQLRGVRVLGGFNENLLKWKPSKMMHNSLNILKAIELFTLYSALYGL